MLGNNTSYGYVSQVEVEDDRRPQKHDKLFLWGDCGGDWDFPENVSMNI
jgi:hypothetical protein